LLGRQRHRPARRQHERRPSDSDARVRFEPVPNHRRGSHRHTCALSDDRSGRLLGQQRSRRTGRRRAAVRGVQRRVGPVDGAGRSPGHITHRTCRVSVRQPMPYRDPGTPCDGAGAGGEGQLGTGAERDYHVAHRVYERRSFDDHPCLLAGLSAGAHHVCGVTHERAIFCWGRGSAGQLGQRDHDEQRISGPRRGRRLRGCSMVNRRGQTWWLARCPAEPARRRRSRNRGPQAGGRPASCLATSCGSRSGANPS
jgi:hypothetical protein